MRTLDALRNLSKEEAVLFQAICRYRIATRTGSFLVNDEKLLKEFNIIYDQILLLEECSLLNSSGLIIRHENIATERALKFTNKQLCILAKLKSGNQKTIEFGNFPFTSIGNELANLLEVQIDNESFICFAKMLQKENPNVEFNVYKYVPIANNMVQFFGEDFLSNNKEENSK